MISVAEATEIILSHSIVLPEESVGMEDSLNKVLAEDIYADRDFPPFDRVTMDGIAINFGSFGQGAKDFPIEGIHTAGSKRPRLNNTKNCLEVMTGAILPKGTDTIIRYEDVKIQDGQARILIDEIRQGQNIHRQGTDRRKNDLLIQKGTKITPAEIGALATVGKSVVQVKRLPKVVIISTGDELVDIISNPEPHQIRKSNVYNLKAALSDFGVIADLQHIADDLDETTRRIGGILDEYDVILLSGGVSKGKADFVPEALEKSGVQKQFHRINQRPGKPFWFGVKGEKAVFAFPGNPVSTFLCYQKYFRPWMRKSLGLKPEKPSFAVLNKDFSFKPELTYFLQTTIHSDKKTAQLLAEPLAGKGSGDLANLLESEGFLELPPDREFFSKGEVYQLIPFK